MRPVEVSPDQVREAGERLLAGGKRVNGWSLRRALDNRGRPDRLMQVWEQERDAAVPQDGPQPDTAPVSLPPGIAEMAEQARTTLVAQIDGIVLAVVRRAETDLQNRYKADFDRLAAERADMADQLASASASVGATEDALADAAAESDALRARLAEAEKAAAVGAERLRAVEEKARADAAEAEEQIAALEGQIAAFGAAAQAAQRAQAAAEATAAAAEREAERLRAQMSALIAALDAPRAETAPARGESRSALAPEVDRGPQTA